MRSKALELRNVFTAIAAELGFYQFGIAIEVAGTGNHQLGPFARRGLNPQGSATGVGPLVIGEDVQFVPGKGFG
jgi:hypothetical protein